VPVRGCSPPYATRGSRVLRRWAAPINAAVLEDMKDEHPVEQLNPEALVMPRQAVERVQRALEALPVDFREVIVLRELKGLSYREIAAVTGMPIETVISRLARGRERLLAALKAEPTTEGAGELS
jgi:RNA polymerase sigma factor (sigma-70 family)